MSDDDDESRQPALKDATMFAVEESRMILPGVQALFGFQLIAVFNNGFRQLSAFDRRVHFLALMLVALAAGLLMAPAAYHRIAERGRLSERFLKLASRLVSSAFLPLGLGLALDIFVVAALALDDRTLAVVAGAGTGVVLLVLWFGWPVVTRLRRRKGRARA
jgi:hypothetical protein